MTNRIVSEHVNTEGELISIETCQKPGPFFGRHLLVVHDDPECSNTKAPILIDQDLKAWLLEELADLDVTDPTARE